MGCTTYCDVILLLPLPVFASGVGERFDSAVFWLASVSIPGQLLQDFCTHGTNLSEFGCV